MDEAPRSASAGATDAALPRPAAPWHAGIALGAVAVAPLTWLLARVIWLPFYFGTFFFLVAGLLVGAIAFRVARPARPLSSGRIAGGAVLIALAAIPTGIYWEYRGVAATLAEPPAFAAAHAHAAEQGRPPGEVGRAARAAFQRYLREGYPPGGAIGYMRWAIASGRARLVLPGGWADGVAIGHRRAVWCIRTMAAYALLAAGLWSQLESLRSPVATTNLLAPGVEEAP